MDCHFCGIEDMNVTLFSSGSGLRICKHCINHMLDMEKDIIKKTASRRPSIHQVETKHKAKERGFTVIQGGKGAE